MQKWLQKILLLVAIATIMGHNTLPHHHHVATAPAAHQHDHHEKHGSDNHHHHHGQNTEDHHNIFSFAQLDDDFLPSQLSKINIDLAILYLLTPVISFRLTCKEVSKNYFGYYREFPPPDHYSSHLFSRPPPVKC